MSLGSIPVSSTNSSVSMSAPVETAGIDAAAAAAACTTENTRRALSLKKKGKNS